MLIVIKILVFSLWLVVVKETFEATFGKDEESRTIFGGVHGIDPTKTSGNIFIVTTSLLFAVVLALIEFL